MAFPLTALAILGASCGGNDVSIALVLRAPQAVLDNATSVELRVVEQGHADCEGAKVEGSPPTDKVQIFSLEQSGCKPGAKWCKDIAIDKDGDERVFSVVARNGDTPIGEGCAEVIVDQDPLEVDITIKRFIPDLCCGNGVTEPGEQCDNGALAQVDCSNNPASSADAAACLGITEDAVCHCDCLAREILISPEGAPPSMNNEHNTKFDLALSFANNTGNIAGGLRAVYTDSSASAGTTPDINIMTLSGTLAPYLEPPQASLSLQRRLGSCSEITKQIGTVLTQAQPDIDVVSDTFAAVVYASDEAFASRFDVFLDAQGPNGCRDTAVEPAAPLQANVRTGTESLSYPAVAGGPGNAALVAWADGGAARGRIWTGGNSFEPATNIELGAMTPGTRLRVAGNSENWWVTYANAGQIFRVSVSSSGAAGAPEQVNTTSGTSESPDIASLPDGRSAVVWRNAGSIYLQRYDAAGAPLPADQAIPINPQTAGSGYSPIIDGSELKGGFYAIAWLAVTDGEGNVDIWGRFADGVGGFLFNHVDGQSGDYLVNHPALPNRARLGIAVAIGGEPGFVAIGWLDDTLPTDFAHNGMYVRRFPLPDLL